MLISSIRLLNIIGFPVGLAPCPRRYRLCWRRVRVRTHPVFSDKYKSGN